MEIFNNDFGANNPTDDVLTALEILKTARPAERKAFMENLNPDDKFAQQLKVVDQEYAKAVAAKEIAPVAEVKAEVAEPAKAE